MITIALGEVVSDETLKEILDQLFLECEHGDEEHRRWLKDKFEDFRKRIRFEQP